MLSGVGGSVASCLRIVQENLQSTVSAGASGAIFGLCGASLSELITNWTLYDDKVNKSTSPSWDLIEVLYIYFPQLTFDLSSYSVCGHHVTPSQCWREHRPWISTENGQFSSYRRFRSWVLPRFCFLHQASVWIHKQQVYSIIPWGPTYTKAQLLSIFPSGSRSCRLSCYVSC